MRKGWLQGLTGEKYRIPLSYLFSSENSFLPLFIAELAVSDDVDGDLVWSVRAGGNWTEERFVAKNGLLYY